MVVNKLQVIEIKGERVLTTKQIAEMYETTEEKIRWNFKYNREKYKSGKHYIMISGDELREFKRECEFQTLFKQAKSVCFWTEKGALLHAKSLNTDKAWEVYDYLVDFYFRSKNTLRQQASKQEPKKEGKLVVDAPENTKIIEATKKVSNDLICISVLLENCNKFVSKEEYEERRKLMMEVVSILMADMIHFTAINPNIVHKEY